MNERRPLDKPARVQDRKALDAARLPWCEVCGIYAGPGVSMESAHVKSRGSGGDDVAGNLLSLCTGFRSNHCHRRAHTGKLRPREIREALQRRAEEAAERLLLAPSPSPPFASAPPLDPPAHEQAIDYLASQEMRIAAAESRIAREGFGASRVPKSTRGAAREVVCLDWLDPSTGLPWRYRTVSDAARAAGRRPHHIHDAIVRSGRCNGRRYAYTEAQRCN